MDIEENFTLFIEQIIDMHLLEKENIKSAVQIINGAIKEEILNKDKIGNLLNVLIEDLKEYPEFNLHLDEIEPIIKNLTDQLGITWVHILNLLRSKELGFKFPIKLEPYTKEWLLLYEKEKRFLLDTFYPEVIISTEHFGSTAIPGLTSKPIIDILVEITSFEKAKEKMVSTLETLGYLYFWRSDSPPGHINMVKGYEPEIGQKIHLHMAPRDHPLWNRLKFRDYLREFPAIAQQYAQLKLELSSKYKNDREAYTNGKQEFVLKITDEAIKYYEKK